jgi:hypothetical protein
MGDSRGPEHICALFVKQEAPGSCWNFPVNLGSGYEAVPICHREEK